MFVCVAVEELGICWLWEFVMIVVLGQFSPLSCPSAHV